MNHTKQNDLLEGIRLIAKWSCMLLLINFFNNYLRPIEFNFMTFFFPD